MPRKQRQEGPIAKQGPSHKLVVLVPPEVYRGIGDLAFAADPPLAHEDGTPRYAEIARVLLVSELLQRKGLSASTTVVGMAVASNATLILSGIFADLLHRLRDDVVGLSARTARAKPSRLESLRDMATQSQRRRGPTPQPIINLTFDEWLYRTLMEFAAAIGQEEVSQAGYRTAVPYAIAGLLRAGLARGNADLLIRAYGSAIADVRKGLDAAVLSILPDLRARLRPTA